MPHTSPYPFDPRMAIRHLTRADRRLARLVGRVGNFRMALDRGQSPFESLLEAIVYQQLHGKAAATILARVKALFGATRFPSPEEILAASDASLRAAGLSRQKMAAIQDLAVKTLDGTVPTLKVIRRLTDDEIVERFTSVRGIGVWTAEMFLIFRLGRPDVLPVHDYGIQQGFALTYRLKDLPKPRQIAEYGERWRPYRTVASWYLWRAVELEQRKSDGKAR